MSAYEENIADASISVRNGRLIIESGADLGFTVHTPDGTRIASGKTKAGTASIVLPEGVYLVRAKQDCIQSFNLKQIYKQIKNP